MKKFISILLPLLLVAASGAIHAQTGDSYQTSTLTEPGYVEAYASGKSVELVRTSDPENYLLLMSATGEVFHIRLGATQSECYRLQVIPPQAAGEKPTATAKRYRLLNGPYERSYLLFDTHTGNTKLLIWNANAELDNIIDIEESAFRKRPSSRVGTL